MNNGTPEEPDKISKKQKILNVATDLFMKRDFKTVSTSEIAKEAGVGKGTLFHHYANKHLLALAVLDEFLNQMNNQFKHMKENLKPKEIIIGMIDFLVDIFESSAGSLQLLTQLIADLNYLSKKPQNEVEMQIQKEIQKIEKLWIAYIEEFAVVFEKIGFEKPLAYSRMFIGMLDGLSLQFLLNPKPDEKLMKQLTTSMIEIFTRK
ncbi:MAG: TetR/AcrR family transcriptional regulator [Candidatus Kariarchaeaceae archaeon]|jgi:AcrR family transcriptional regulator